MSAITMDSTPVDPYNGLTPAEYYSEALSKNAYQIRYWEYKLDNTRSTATDDIQNIRSLLETLNRERNVLSDNYSAAVRRKLK